MTPPPPSPPPLPPSTPASPGPVPGCSGPGSPHPNLARLVTASVWILRGQTRSRSFAPTARVVLLDSEGAPAGDPSTNLLGAAVGDPDHALRVDLAVAGLDQVLARGGAGAPRRTPWRAALVTVRPGPLESTDGDHAWRRAWLVACEIVGARPDPVYVATRTGWFDLTAPGDPVFVPRLRAPRGRSSGRH